MSEISKTAEGTVYPILFAISISHMLNDTIQSVIPSIYPILKNTLSLNFSQLGIITMCFQLTSSIFQPVIGYYTDMRPKPYSLAIGMTITLAGLIALSMADTFTLVLISVALIGSGSAVFHPEASRVAYLASGGRRGFAQAFFQVGGNSGSAIGPLLAALIVVPYGQSKIIWFSVAAIVAILVLIYIGNWYRSRRLSAAQGTTSKKSSAHHLSGTTVVISLAILLVLMFSKFFYMASFTNFYTFYLIEKFQVSIQEAQYHLFIFLFAIAAGTLGGGPLGDKIGRKTVIWISILGAAPFTLLIPYANLFWTTFLSIFIGLIIASAFSAILVYAQELVPGKVGMISGLFFGLAFGIAGVGSALLGKLADATSITYVFHLCAWLPIFGIITTFLPDLRKKTKI